MKYIIISIFIFLFSCQSHYQSSCAEIEVYNPSSGHTGNYTLKVDVENGKLTKLYFPNGGWLDDDHFTPPEIIDNYATFTNDKGYEYEVWLVDESNCDW